MTTSCACRTWTGTAERFDLVLPLRGSRARLRSARAVPDGEAAAQVHGVHPSHVRQGPQGTGGPGPAGAAQHQPLRGELGNRSTARKSINSSCNETRADLETAWSARCAGSRTFMRTKAARPSAQAVREFVGADLRKGAVRLQGGISQPLRHRREQSAVQIRSEARPAPCRRESVMGQRRTAGLTPVPVMS